MYNAYPPGSYGQPPGYGPYLGAPPGMGGPPGMAPPGASPVPGFQQVEGQPSRPGAFPASFHPPANMPNINFSAPVIRLGTLGPAKPDARDERPGRRAGLGADSRFDSGRDRERPTQIAPPSKEEVIRTIFVGGITEGCGGDEGIERILRTAGNLRRWLRATDSDDKPCKFGFAEYEDPESLSTAIEVLRDIEVPIKRQIPAEVKIEQDEAVEKSTLLVLVDENSTNYVEQWEESQGGRDEASREFQVDQAREELQAVLRELANPSAPVQKDELSSIDRDGDIHMADGVRIDSSGADIVTIPITVDDDLSDIPAEMRETVAREITAFRDRSVRRDLERLKREEEIEQQERNRMMNGNGVTRPSRLASPPPSAPAGPAGGVNGVPVGPKSFNAPSGPKGYGSQIPRDYQKGVMFVNGTGISGSTAFADEDTDASDAEIDRRRRSKQDAEHEKIYLDQERRWLNRERSRTAAVEREKARDDQEEGKHEEEKDVMAKRLKGWDDDVESKRGTEEYYADRSMWLRKRLAFRGREAQNDDADRSQEQRETLRSQGRPERDVREERRPYEEPERERPLTAEAIREPARFKIGLGAAAAQRAKDREVKEVQAKRTVADVEGLLEDEEEADPASQRKLQKIDFGSTGPGIAHLSEEERQAAARQLAQEIPTDKEGLWSWEIRWEFVGEEVIDEKLRPFVEKRVVEALGVLEGMIVDVVVSGLRNKSPPQPLVEELEGALDEEAEVLVRKLWRMLIFFSECEKRGIAA